jgi:hypothetical protein
MKNASGSMRSAPQGMAYMLGRGGLKSREGSFGAAARHHPHAIFMIRVLMKRSEAFRDMCDDLAAAEQALLQLSEASAELRESRRAEWQELIDRLVAEIGNVISEHRPGKDSGD